MRHSAGWAVSAVLVVAATAANAQGPGGRYQPTSDFEAPYAGGPPLPPPAITARRPLMARRLRLTRRRRDTGPSILPVQEVYAVLRDNGFSPLGAPFQRGLTYVIAVMDRGGEDGRLVIDARNGRIIRFMPASRWGGGYYGERSGYYGDRYAPPPPYGPPGVLPPIAPISGEARPTVSAPHLASRGVPLPQPKPALAGRQPDVTPQKSATVQGKPEKSAAVQAKPEAIEAGRRFFSYGSGRRSVDARSGRDRARAGAEARAGDRADAADAEGAGAGVAICSSFPGRAKREPGIRSRPQEHVDEWIPGLARSLSSGRAPRGRRCGPSRNDDNNKNAPVARGVSLRNATERVSG